MSFPEWITRHELTDFVIEENANCLRLRYEIYQKPRGDESNQKKEIACIEIPQFCNHGKEKLGVFLKDFSTLLCEMLVKWDKDTVERLYTEAMSELFCEDAADYELGFYEKFGFLYCTIQLSEEGHKKIYGEGRNGTWLARELSFAWLPPKRTRFQDVDPSPAWKQIEAKALRRQRHPRRVSSLRDYIERGYIELDDENEKKEEK